MARVRIFSSRGFIPKKGMHPALAFFLFAYVIVVVFLWITSDVKTIRFTGPGFIPIITLISISRNKKDKPVNFYLDKIDNDELCIGYRQPGNDDQVDYYVDEYSYWYRSNLKDMSRQDLYVKIKTVHNQLAFLREENTTLANSEKWESQDIRANEGEIIINVQDLEGLAVEMDRYSS